MRLPLEELRCVLEEGQRHTARLLRCLEQEGDLLELVTLLESLTVHDEGRTRLLEQFRKAASAERQRQEERSIRQFVLGALSELDKPQTAGFLEDYVWIVQQVEVKSRGMGSLRRDEYRAWHRRHARPRLAYIVPCLDDTGRSVARWLSRSDWPLAQRMCVGRAQEMWITRGICSLLDACEATTDPTRTRFLPIISRWANEVSGQAPAECAFSDGDLSRLKADFNSRLHEIETEVVKLQEETALTLVGADEEELLWGRKQR